MLAWFTNSQSDVISVCILPPPRAFVATSSGCSGGEPAGGSRENTEPETHNGQNSRSSVCEHAGHVMFDLRCALEPRLQDKLTCSDLTQLLKQTNDEWWSVDSSPSPVNVSNIVIVSPLYTGRRNSILQSGAALDAKRRTFGQKQQCCGDKWKWSSALFARKLSCHEANHSTNDRGHGRCEETCE